MGNLEILTRRRTGGAGAFTPGKVTWFKPNVSNYSEVVLNLMNDFQLKRIHRHNSPQAKSQSDKFHSEKVFLKSKNSLSMLKTHGLLQKE